MDRSMCAWSIDHIDKQTDKLLEERSDEIYTIDLYK